MLGDGPIAATTAASLTAAGRRVARSLPAAVDVAYVCVEEPPGDGRAFDLAQVHRAAAELRAAWPSGAGPLVVLCGHVPVGTADWLQHVLSGRFPVAFRPARLPESGVLGIPFPDAARRIAELERLAEPAPMTPREAELAQHAAAAIRAVEAAVSAEVARIAAPDAPWRRHRPEPEAEVLLSMAELADRPMPVLEAACAGWEAAATRLSQIAIGRAYLAGLPESAVAGAGPEGPPAGTSRLYPIAKRALDVSVAVVALAVLALPMALIGLLVRLEDGGPALFRARRAGRCGRPFAMLKFRSMRVDAPPSSNKSETERYATRVGGVLRRTNLDELPQLINLLRGEMSLVGPRPEQTFIADWYQPWQRERLSVPPGITGWWQVHMRGRNQEMYQHVELDVWYVRHRSFPLDVRILLATPAALLRSPGPVDAAIPQRLSRAQEQST